MALLLSSELLLMLRNFVITIIFLIPIVSIFIFAKYKDNKDATYLADRNNLPLNTVILMQIWTPRKISPIHRLKYVGKSFGYGIALYILAILFAIIKNYIKTGILEYKDFFIATSPILLLILFFCLLDSLKAGLFKPLYHSIAYVGDTTSLDARIQTLVFYDHKRKIFSYDKIPARRIKTMLNSTNYDNCIDIVLVEEHKRFRIVDVYKPTKKEKENNSLFLCTKSAQPETVQNEQNPSRQQAPQFFRDN